MPAPRTHYLRDFWSFVKPYRRPLRTVYLLYFLNSALNLLPALSVRYYIDLVLLDKDASFCGHLLHGMQGASLTQKTQVTLLFVAAVIVLIIIANVIGVAMWRLGTRSAEHVVYDIKMQIHHHLNKLSLGYFSSERTGTIMTKAVGDAMNVSQFLRSSYNLLYAFVHLLLAPLLMLLMSPLLFLIVLIPIPLISYAFYSIKKRLKPLYRQQREQESQINSQMQEIITGIREIKAFNMEDRSGAHYRDVNWQFYTLQNRIMRVFSFNHQLQYGSRDVGVILIATLGGICALRGWGDVTVGKISSFMVLSAYLYNPISTLLGFYDVIQRGMVSLERIIDFLGEMPDVQDAHNARAVRKQDIHGQVTFDQVAFAYEPGKPTLHDISFDVQPGQRVAIVGPSGSGKSTLLMLLLRFYDVDQGRIMIDQHDVRAITQMSLRMCAGIVFQDTFLFYGTIRDNLLFVNPTKGEQDMQAACKAANIHDEIMRLPDGFDTRVGERGVKLSGGQKQRLAIARVFLKDPAIVILDEATSAVDTVSERLIQDGIERMLQGRTAFIVAHRLSTVRKCDTIVVLDRGRLAEHGTHAELVARAGIYAGLCQHNRL